MNPGDFSTSDYFLAFLRVGFMLLIMMTSEYLAYRFLSRRFVGSLARSLGWLLGIALVAYAVIELAQGGAPAVESEAPPESSAGIVLAVILLVAVTAVIVIHFFTRRIGPRALAVAIGAFYGFAILAYFAWKQILAQPLSDDNMVFLSVSTALVILALLALALRPLLFEQPIRLETMKINPLEDPSKFGEARRKRLNKKRSRY